LLLFRDIGQQISSDLIVKKIALILIVRRACNPVDLFDAAVEKFCPPDYVNIKVLFDL